MILPAILALIFIYVILRVLSALARRVAILMDGPPRPQPGTSILNEIAYGNGYHDARQKRPRMPHSGDPTTFPAYHAGYDRGRA